MPAFLRLSFITKLVLAMLLTTTAAYAGEIVLKNGDRLSGDLVSSDGTSLVWASESFGELKIKAANVANISSTQMFKIAGYDSACNFSSSTHVSCFEEHADPIEWVLSSKIERWVDYKDEYENTGLVRLAGKSERGNKLSDSLTIEAETSWAKADMKHRLYAYYDGDRPSDQEEALTEYRLQYYIDWYFKDRVYLNGYAAAEADDKSGVDSRYKVGTGVGYRILQKDNHKLTVESGPSWLEEEYVASFGGGSSDRLAMRWYLDWSFKFTNDISLFHNHEYLYSDSDNQRSQFKTRSGFHFPMGRGMYTELRHEYSYDSEPVDASLDEDSKITIGVGYNW